MKTDGSESTLQTHIPPMAIQGYIPIIFGLRVFSPNHPFYQCFQTNFCGLCYFSVLTNWCRNPSDLHVGLTQLTVLWRMSLLQPSVSNCCNSSYFFRHFLSHPQFLILLPNSKLKFPAMILCSKKNIQICCLLVACLDKREANSFKISFSARLSLLFTAGSCVVWFRSRNIV